MNENTREQTSSSCRDRVVTAVTGVALFAGLINLAAFSVLACPRDSVRSGRNWPKPLATGKPEDGVWSGRRCWPRSEFLSREVNQQNKRIDEQH